ncbi:MAG: DUF3662 domain-containing protein [Chloroflexi bacterium]|nr:DUF3662 domain-containing protein [Chloroflexota bacterium]
MSANTIHKLEGRLEALVEGAIARLFSGKPSARDIAILLLRALDDRAHPAGETSAVRVAPDRYRIYVHPQNERQLREQMPDLSARLASLVTELCQAAGLQLYSAPEIHVLPNDSLAARQVRICAEHSPSAGDPTKRMVAISVEGAPPGLDGDTQPLPPH